MMGCSTILFYFILFFKLFFFRKENWTEIWILYLLLAEGLAGCLLQYPGASLLSSLGTAVLEQSGGGGDRLRVISHFFL